MRPRLLILIWLIWPALLAPSLVADASTHRRPPERATARLAGQLRGEAQAVARQLAGLPRPSTPRAEAMAGAINAFASGAASLDDALDGGRPGDAYADLDRLNGLAWRVHNDLEHLPEYRTLFEPWVRTVALLRRLGESMKR